VQQPRPPILIGGESKAALRRAARLGDGWLGIGHTFASAAAQIKLLTDLRRLYERPSGEPDFQIIVGGAVESRADVDRWQDLGVTRLIVSPWRRSREAIDGLRAFADRAL
jgi:alkanesulfonate monooxygenase SsuD/methylene tetrahydromethanopterin reductase-like flavin-dependent oxidoreductase (luciferase family)